MDVVPLQSYNLAISNVSFPDGLQNNTIDGTGTGCSVIPASKGCTMNISIKNWTVAGAQVTMHNFQSDKLGQFKIDASYWGQWSITPATDP